MPVITRTRLRVTGRVQGVFFRQSTREKARSLKLSGWVKNTQDGAVELEASGAPAAVDELVSWCHKGPPSASVAGVEIIWRQDAEEEWHKANDFVITY